MWSNLGVFAIFKRSGQNVSYPFFGFSFCFHRLLSAPPNLNSIARIQKDGKEVTVNADELDKVRELGRGAYGVVDLMKHKSTGLFMAVKVNPLFSCKYFVDRLFHLP